MTSLLQRVPLLLIVTLVLGLLASPGGACPFCSMQGQTLTGEVGQAKLVLYGKLTNADENANNGDGATDLAVETVIKNDLKGKKDDPVARNKIVRLDRYVPTPAQVDADKYRYLVYCDLFKGKIDPYRVLPVLKNGDMAKYLLGALSHKDDKIGKRLRFFFDYLDNPDLEISNDAYKEFGNADYKDYQKMAKGLPADRVAKWLTEDKNTPAFRYGLYASMLGHCGTEKHAKLLRDMLEDPAKSRGSGVDGMLAGYVMLKPKEGWQYTRDILKDPQKEFLLRYAALRTVRFLWDSRPDLVNKKELTAGMSFLLEQSDIADLAVDDLRKRECWDVTDHVLALRKTKAYEIPIVRRAILRFALSCKGNTAAAAYVAEQRKQDAQMVADAEELLKLEQMPPASGASK
jgi:hypothetical protein